VTRRAYDDGPWFALGNPSAWSRRSLPKTSPSAQFNFPPPSEIAFHQPQKHHLRRPDQSWAAASGQGPLTTFNQTTGLADPGGRADFIYGNGLAPRTVVQSPTDRARVPPLRRVQTGFGRRSASYQGANHAARRSGSTWRNVFDKKLTRFRRRKAGEISWRRPPAKISGTCARAFLVGRCEPEILGLMHRSPGPSQVRQLAGPPGGKKLSPAAARDSLGPCRAGGFFLGPIHG